MNLFSQTWSSTGFLNGPAVFEAPVDCSLAEAETLTPLSDRKIFSVVSNPVVSAGIAALFFLCAPLAIFFAVMAIIISSINGFIWRALSHVFQEIKKCVPTVTDLNTPATIVVERWVFLISTSLKHSGPDAVSARIDESMFESPPMRSHTATRSDTAISKIGRGNQGVSARAFAHPSSGVFSIFRNALNSGQFAESIARLNSGCHRLKV